MIPAADAIATDPFGALHGQIFGEPPTPLALTPARRPAPDESPVRLPADWWLRLAVGGTLEVGGPSRPFVAEGRDERVLRRLLDRLERSAAREVRLWSYGPDLVGHGERLARLDERHGLVLEMPMPSLDALRAHRHDPRGPHPQARLWAIARLAARGLAVRARIAAEAEPDERFEHLLRALAEAGVWDVALADDGGRWPGRARGRGPGAERRACLREARLRHGFPRGGGRG